MTPVEQIKDRLNIVDVVSMYVKLDSAGKNLKGKSPFTNEKTPSFFVSPEKGLYHCFSTGKGGDIFTFVQEMEGLDFKGALKVLADRAGVKLGNFNKEVSNELDKLYDVTEESTRIFEENFKNSKEALDYLKSRGVEDYVIKDFRLGYSPLGWRNLYDVLKVKFTDKEIVLAGLGKKTDKGIYDTFRDRIMFPITDTAGRPIGFSGRILHDVVQPSGGKSAKYVNSPDTPLFNKSDVLFGLDKAKNFIRKYNFTILVEGQFDVVMMHQAGFRNTVGVSGTALADSLSGANGVNNLGLVKRLSNNIVLAFDSDVAGIRATKRSAAIALTLGMDVKAISIPGVKDPADFILESGKTGFESLLHEAKHIIEFSVLKIKENAKDERDIGNKIRTEVLPDVAKLQSEIEKSYFIKRISELIDISQDILWKDLEKIDINSPEQQHIPDQIQPDNNRADNIERRLMGIYYSKSEDQKIKDSLSKIIGEEKFEELVKKFSDLKQELIFETETNELEEEGSSLDEMMKNLEEDYLSVELEDIKLKLKKAEVSSNDEEANKLTLLYQDLAKRLGEIKNSRHINNY
jgi:DNA primase